MRSSRRTSGPPWLRCRLTPGSGEGGVERKVGPNCHVRFDKNHYSAPERYIGRQVDVRVGERMVEVFLERGGERIAVHRRKSGRNQVRHHPRPHARAPPGGL